MGPQRPVARDMAGPSTVQGPARHESSSNQEFRLDGGAPNFIGVTFILPFSMRWSVFIKNDLKNFVQIILYQALKKSQHCRNLKWFLRCDKAETFFYSWSVFTKQNLIIQIWDLDNFCKDISISKWYNFFLVISFVHGNLSS